MKNIIVALMIIATLGGCQTVLEDVTVPTIPVKPVVFANLNQINNVSRIQLTKSKPIINNSTSYEYDAIPDATVTVSNGSSTYSFTYSALTRDYYYLGVLPLNAGDSYLFSALTSEFGEVKGAVEMPQPIGAYNLTLDSIVRKEEIEYILKIEVPNTAADQYYRIEAFNGYGNDTVEVYSDKEYHSDEDVTSSTISLNTKLYSWEGSGGNSPKLFVIISAITKDHYRYGKVLKNYEPDNPFAEPTPLPNNIEGGLGIFTLSNSQIIKIE
ncbi:MAG: hypothetical protein COA58_10370 [Bacteroidetes bacterium]|nr:MAG: hypothetical protein COA58_10370 [Bacteroidota bacterium]